jgi:hypothetical protein
MELKCASLVRQRAVMYLDVLEVVGTDIPSRREKVSGSGSKHSIRLLGNWWAMNRAAMPIFALASKTTGDALSGSNV